MTEETPIINPPAVEVKTVPKTYDHTIYKSGYWYGGQFIQLFLNHNVGGHGTFSHIIKKGNYSLIHNLVNKEENIAYAKAILSKLSPAEIALLGYEQIRKE